MSITMERKPKLGATGWSFLFCKTSTLVYHLLSFYFCFFLFTQHHLKGRIRGEVIGKGKEDKEGEGGP